MAGKCTMLTFESIFPVLRTCVPPLPADFMKEVAAFAGLVYSYWKMFRHHSMRVVFGRALCQQRYFASIRMSRNRIG
jgi:hypothetical protein